MENLTEEALKKAEKHEEKMEILSHPLLLSAESISDYLENIDGMIAYHPSKNRAWVNVMFPGNFISIKEKIDFGYNLTYREF